MAEPAVLGVISSTPARWLVCGSFLSSSFFVCLFVVVVVPALLPFMATLVFVPSVFCCCVAGPLFFFFVKAIVHWLDGKDVEAGNSGYQQRGHLFFFFSLARTVPKRQGKKKEANGREHISQASTREEVVVKEKEKEGAFPRVHHSFWCCSRREIAMVSVTVTGLYCFPVCACFFFSLPVCMGICLSASACVFTLSDFK